MKYGRENDIIGYEKKGQFFKGFTPKVSGITYCHHSVILKVFDLTRCRDKFLYRGLR